MRGALFGRSMLIESCAKPLSGSFASLPELGPLRSSFLAFKTMISNSEIKQLAWLVSKSQAASFTALKACLPSALPRLGRVHDEGAAVSEVSSIFAALVQVKLLSSTSQATAASLALRMNGDQSRSYGMIMIVVVSSNNICSSRGTLFLESRLALGEKETRLLWRNHHL